MNDKAKKSLGMAFGAVIIMSAIGALIGALVEYAGPKTFIVLVILLGFIGLWRSAYLHLINEEKQENVLKLKKKDVEVGQGDS